MNINHIREVIFALKEKGEMELFDLNSKFRLTPYEATQAVEKLSEMRVLHFNGQRFKLKEKLSESQIVSIYNIIRKVDFRLESNIIDRYKEKSQFNLESEFYCPNFEKLDPYLLVDYNKN
ncbi:hypothetical protein B7489_23215 [Vibrio alginolyticus]|uniref:hypothetical protein n=1 Tax=Vibrio harveyi group TaxID=717610 RepID=UPI000A1F77FB|nr:MULTISPECIES: hypothetical protein [Vibrio harveyi group]MDF5078222.1 hypothetical protein [Vibrio parahaemolyticus]MDF5414825.1 hypothetical protein [Vibrio parahaemolyticus]MDF5425062.1 hypothetical protein [Vibrio parahaemolyticus]OSP09040.1 hypothetical protein B7489_23215 [Vibrio alginolyticus]HBC3864235.1 hypothetical protein [Vibrio parahaemolyticus]